MNDEHFPRSPALGELVAQVRATQPPSVSVTLDDVRTELATATASRRWKVAGVAMAAAAAVALVFALDGGDTTPPAATVVAHGGVTPNVSEAEAPAHTPEPPAASAPARSLVEAPAAPSASGALEPSSAAVDPATAIQLAPGVTINTESGPAPVVVSAWTVEVAGGVYRISTPVQAESALSVHHDERVLVVQANTSVVLSDGDLEIERGAAAWRADVRPAHPDAKTLTARAEAAMARGENAAAIRALRSLARHYPRAPGTHAGLIDLARLLNNSGSPDRARCAYKVALKRWPHASTAPDIKRALARLGDGPNCRGLSPE